LAFYQCLSVRSGLEAKNLSIHFYAFSSQVAKIGMLAVFQQNFHLAIVFSVVGSFELAIAIQVM
jgi:hypothetical protein